MEKKKTLEEHITNLAQAMNKGFSELHRRMDLNNEDNKEIRQLIAKGLKTMEIRFDGLEKRFDGLATTVDHHDSAIAKLQKAVGQK